MELLKGIILSGPKRKEKEVSKRCREQCVVFPYSQNER